MNSQQDRRSKRTQKHGQDMVVHRGDEVCRAQERRKDKLPGDGFLHCYAMGSAAQLSSRHPHMLDAARFRLVGGLWEGRGTAQSMSESTRKRADKTRRAIDRWPVQMSHIKAAKPQARNHVAHGASLHLGTGPGRSAPDATNSAQTNPARL